MKKIFLFLLPFLILHCKKKEEEIPVIVDNTIRLNAEFSYQDSVRSPIQIEFINTTKNMPPNTSSEWEIDGVADIGNRSKISITKQLSVGKHTVTLRVFISNQTPNTFTVTKTITVLPAYTRVGITGVTILNFPAQDLGQDWDTAAEGRFADVYFEISSATTFSLIYKPDLASRKENLQLANLPTGWNGVNNKPMFIQSDLSQKISVTLFDYDGPNTTPRFMTNAQNIYFREAYLGYNNFYPKTLRVTDNKDMLLQFDLEWLD
jgi:hypothetical protein